MPLEKLRAQESLPARSAEPTFIRGRQDLWWVAASGKKPFRVDFSSLGLLAPIPASEIACTAVPSAPLLNKCTQGAQVHLRPPSVHSHRGESARSAYAPAFRLMPEGTIVYLRNSERKYPYVGGLGVCPLRSSERKKTLPGARLCDPTRHFCLRHNPLQGPRVGSVG